MDLVNLATAFRVSCRQIKRQRSTFVVGPCQIPAPPLPNDPVPIVDHFLGQPDYPTQGAAGDREGGLEQQHIFNPMSFCSRTVDPKLTFQTLCWDTTLQAETLHDPGQCRRSQIPA